MPSTNGNLTWTGRAWQIVRADLDLAHVVAPLSSFTFEPTTRKTIDGYTIEGYKIAPTGDATAPHCFNESFLVPVGTHLPTFDAITKKKRLPLFTDKSATEYVDVCDMIALYMERNREFQRLEGVIAVPCHPAGAAAPKGTLADHSSLRIKTLLHVYQFGNVVDGERPLLVMRAPLSPVCPTNGDGTAIGYS